MKDTAELYTDCVAGAWQENETLNLLRQTGFNEIDVKKRRKIELPYSAVEGVLTREEWQAFKVSGNGIFSITVTGIKS